MIAPIGTHRVVSLDAAATLVRERTGLVFGEARRASFEMAVDKSMHRAGLRHLDDYLARLASEPALLDDLVAEITVGETYFFREPRQLDLVRNEILPDLRSHRAPGHRLRIWSAGCASGEEPYSLVIIARELGLQPAAHIVATDLSRAALARAARARYTRWSLRGVPEEVVGAYFARHGEWFDLDPTVQAAVEFGYLNLAEDAYPSLATGIWGMDLIVCRNVLIYFDRDTVARVARRLVNALAEGGWLLLGASDPPLRELVPCNVVVTGAGLAYRRADGPPLTVESPRIQPSLLPPPEPAARTVHVPDPGVPEGTAAVERYYHAREYERAAEVAGRLVERDGGDPGLWILLIRSLANRGDLEMAGRRCAAALDRHRGSAELLYLHSVLLTEAGRHAEAVKAARGALYLDREFVLAHVALGSALARVGEPAAATRAFRNAERLLNGMAPDAAVPAADGELSVRLAEMVRMQLRLQTAVTE